jgi:glycosyltransferase involved in cell wall biosynthesis
MQSFPTSTLSRDRIYVLAPGTGPRWQGGAVLALIRMIPVFATTGTAQLVTYRDRQQDVPFLDDVLDSAGARDLFIISWGPHVKALLSRLASRRVVYWAHSYGWDIDVPATVPVLCATPQLLGIYGESAPNSPLYVLPNVVEEKFVNNRRDRDIDVLVLKRKSSTYLLNTLVPALEASGITVTVVAGFSDELDVLYNRAKVYLYDSRDHCVGMGLTEGFGLQPLEALACGCTVFSSVNGGLASHIDPPFQGLKLGMGLGFDRQRILQCVSNWRPAAADIARYRTSQVAYRWQSINEELTEFFESDPCDTPAYRSMKQVRRRARRRRRVRVLRRRLGRLIRLGLRR